MIIFYSCAHPLKLILNSDPLALCGAEYSLDTTTGQALCKASTGRILAGLLQSAKYYYLLRGFIQWVPNLGSYNSSEGLMCPLRYNSQGFLCCSPLNVSLVCFCEKRNSRTKKKHCFVRFSSFRDNKIKSVSSSCYRP